MNKPILFTIAIFSILLSACGGSSKATSPSGDAKPPAASATTAGGAATSVVKEIYENAIKRNCAALPASLTEEFKKEVGTSSDSLDALCDTFTDSGKVTAVDVKGEELSGDSGRVKVKLTHKDGKTEDKDENVKKVNGKWLMDS
jgi:hypothetical protein